MRLSIDRFYFFAWFACLLGHMLWRGNFILHFIGLKLSLAGLFVCWTHWSDSLFLLDFFYAAAHGRAVACLMAIKLMAAIDRGVRWSLLI
jgi:hypothetical protein